MTKAPTMTAVTPGREELAVACLRRLALANINNLAQRDLAGEDIRSTLEKIGALAAKPTSSTPTSELDAAGNACLELCSRHGFATGHGDTVADIIREIDVQITERLAAKPAEEDVREEAARLLEARADGFLGRLPDAIFSGRLVAEELRFNADKIRALSTRAPKP